jgi:quercetin dioxygenase-like cupin family protein
MRAPHPSSRPGTPETLAPRHVPCGSGEELRALDGTRTTKLGAASTGGTFSLSELAMPAGAGAPMHLHTREDEVFRVQEGRFAFEVEERAIIATAGDLLFIPRGVLRSFRNIAAAPGRLLALVVPGAIEEMRRELSRLTGDGLLHETTLRSLLREHGVEMLAVRTAADHNDQPHYTHRRLTMTTTHQRPLFVPDGTGPLADLGDHRARIKVSARDTDGAFLLADTDVDPQGGVPPHIHDREDETFYILAGRFAIEVGEQSIEAGPGDTVFAPRGIPHTWRCISDTPGRFILLITPGANFEAFAIEMGRHGFVPAAAMADPALAAEFIALTSRYGIQMLPPAG